MTSFTKKYEERKEQFRREVINHYNYELSKANSIGETLQVAEDAISSYQIDYKKENNAEVLVTKGALVASAVVGGIVAVATSLSAPSELLSSSLFAASLTLGVGAIAGIAGISNENTFTQSEKLAKALFEKEIINLQNNKRFANYVDILFEASTNTEYKEFFKNTMLFSDEFTKKVAEEVSVFKKVLSVNPYVFKGMDKIQQQLSEKVSDIKEQNKLKKASM